MPRVAKRESELEAAFQAELIRDLYAIFPGCVVLKNDSSYMQGIPDLTIFYKNKWAWLEVKAAWNSAHQPNQDYYVEMGDAMSFGAFIFPENKDEILDEIQTAFRAARTSRVPQRQ